MRAMDLYQGPGLKTRQFDLIILHQNNGHTGSFNEFISVFKVTLNIDSIKTKLPDTIVTSWYDYGVGRPGLSVISIYYGTVKMLLEKCYSYRIYSELTFKIYPACKELCSF
jgi:hypothetical protein